MLSLVLLAVTAEWALAALTPTAPGPGDSFAAGSDCTIKWDADTNGQWTNVSISLMSGSNNNMTRVTTVASGLDGTDSSLSPYKWTCPDVRPYSAIYFYQFTNGDDKQDSAWTTRFTITSPDGDNDSPAHNSQPNGDAIPWGEGRLASGDDTDSAEDASTDDSTPNDEDSSGGDDTGDTPSATRGHKHSDPDSPTDTAGSSTYRASDSLGLRPTHGAHPSGNGEVAEDLVPTASLPTKKAHASRSGSPSSTSLSSSGMPCSDMGPGVPQMGSMQLASGASPNPGLRWLKTALFYTLSIAALSLCLLLLGLHT